MPNVSHAVDTRVSAGILSIRFDDGHWIVVDHGAKAVLATQDNCAVPRAASITYRNTWGLTKTVRVALRTPKRLDIT